MKTRILETGKCDITQNFSPTHQALDIVGINSSLDYITAHTEGKIIFYQDGYGNQKGSTGNASYGNCIKIEHSNGYATLYAHMEKGLLVKAGQKVAKGQKIGYMGDSGNAYGKHLHFEVWKDNVRINPTNYLDNELYGTSDLEYNVGDTVTINGVYVSSTSEKELVPLKKTGKITRILNDVRNPYLIDNGNIGWVNKNNIVNNIRYLKNSSYKGYSIVEALNQINIDSSFSNRKIIADLNEINNYSGTAGQNTLLLNRLKSGTLKYKK